MTHTFRLIVPALALAIAFIAHAGELRAPAYLDFAPGGEPVAGTIQVTPRDRYEPNRGHGWTTAPTAGFVLPKFGGIRAPALIDGVAGADFTLRLDLAAGRWTCLAFLDDGFRTAHTVEIQVNGRTQLHNPRGFGMESEPGEGPIDRLRVAQFRIDAAGPVELRFRQPNPAARLLALHVLPMDWTETDATRWIREQVDTAGRHNFQASLDILRSELGHPNQKDPALVACAAYWKAQLDLLAEAEHWYRAGGWDEVSAQTHTSMFTRYHLAVALLDPLVEHPDGDAFPLRDRALWQRTRLLYWLYAEQHMPEDQAAFRPDIARLRARYPDDPLVAMYAGEKVPVADDRARFASLAGAPDWSAAEHQALERLRDVAHFWIDHRQIANGEFGGKTDDDVELLRWWPVLIFAGDTKALAGFRRLANGVWFSPRMHLGYSRVARDVEHSAEFVSDTVPLMALATAEPTMVARLGWSYRHMRDLWTGRNPQGELLFKSAWLGATDILTEPPRNRDVSMNARAAKAVRYHAWLTREAAARELLHDWSLGWAKAAGSVEKGKPRGLFPASRRWPDGAVNGDGASWHRADMFWRYYDWNGDGRLYDQLLFSWLTSADDRLLEPLRDTLTFLGAQAAGADLKAEPGSAAWAAAQLLGSANFWNVVAQWRCETNDPRFDAFIARRGPPYLRYRLSGDPAPLAAALQQTLVEVLRYNRPMRTTEPLFTDRVFVSEDDGNTDGADLLTAMLTGCHSAEGASPYFHVAWEEVTDGFTALVKQAADDRLAADLFVHRNGEAKATARCFRLAPGSYRLTVSVNGRTIIDRRETVAGPHHRAALTFPGGQVATLRIVAEPAK